MKHTFFFLGLHIERRLFYVEKMSIMLRRTLHVLNAGLHASSSSSELDDWAREHDGFMHVALTLSLMLFVLESMKLSKVRCDVSG